MTDRLDYIASCRRLASLGWAEYASPPPIPDHRPRYDDPEPLGVNFFRTSVEGDLSNFTLPRTYIGRSETRGASFQNTDLHESTLCWNDFVDVDFSHAVLRGADLRASQFERVSFAEAVLEDADLRHSSFVNCGFDRAIMKGATLARSLRAALPLSASQIAEINWLDDAGEEPDGG